MVMVRMKVLPSLTFLLVLQEVCDCADQCIFCHLEVEPLNEEEQEEKEQLLEEVWIYFKSFIWTWFPPIIIFHLLCNLGLFNMDEEGLQHIYSSLWEIWSWWHKEYSLWNGGENGRGSSALCWSFQGKIHRIEWYMLKNPIHFHFSLSVLSSMLSTN